MILRHILVENFRCIRRAELDLASGLNVFYGPNELGKSTLVEAIRSAFLLPVNSRVADDFIPWGTDAVPVVSVEFDLPMQATDGPSNETSTDGCNQPVSSTSFNRYRIVKSFGSGTRSTATLEQIKQGGRKVEVARGRDVDGKLRTMLEWGIPSPGGRNAPRG